MNRRAAVLFASAIGLASTPFACSKSTGTSSDGAPQTGGAASTTTASGPSSNVATTSSSMTSATHGATTGVGGSTAGPGATSTASATTASSSTGVSSSTSGSSSTAGSTSAATTTASTTGATTTSVATTGASTTGSGNPLQVPCTHGPGWIAWSFHYEPGPGTQAYLDHFGLPDSSNWEAVPAYPTMVADPGNGGGLEIGSGNWILIRYSLAGLTQINSATLSVYGRSYSVSTSGSFDAWSPLYGSAPSPTDSMSNAWPYAWTTIDYSTQLAVGDSPGLTGIRLYSGPSSSDIVVHAVELCIDGH